MGTKYSSQTVSGYNSSPPPDDGSTVSLNQVKWSTIKSKLTDCFNTWATAINNALVTALDTSASTTSVGYTTTATDHQKPIQVTAAVTISLGDAATMAAGYQATIVNLYSAAITVNLATATDTLNTVTNGSISILPGASVTFSVNQAGTGYTIISESMYDASGPTHTFPKITMQDAINYAAEVSIASAATVNIGAAASNNVYITGTTTITAFDTVAAGITRNVRFAGALTLTHNGTSLILPGSTNITTAANDCAEFESLGSGNWVCTKYSRASGAALVLPTITQSNLGSSSVGQGQLKTTTAAYSTQGVSVVSSAAGQYGFGVQINYLSAGAGVAGLFVYGRADSDTYNGGIGGTLLAADSGWYTSTTGYISFRTINRTAGSTSESIAFQERYIQASPPYDLGDGDIPLFIFAQINSSGEVVHSYCAPEAPWHYNGPTDIRATHYINGRGYRRAPSIHAEFPTMQAARAAGLTHAEIARRLRTDPVIDIEITQSVKNADMGLIPHPFANYDPKTGDTIVLLDPVSLAVGDLAALHAAGESLPDLLHNGYLVIGNTAIRRAGPPGVMVVDVKFKH